MRAQAAGEQAVAVGHVHDVRTVHPGRRKAARGQFGPVFQVAGRVAHHHRLARGAAGGVQAHDVFSGHGEQAVGIVVAHILLFGEGQEPQVRQGLDVRGGDSDLVEAFAVKGHIGVHAVAEIAQAAQLQRFQLLAGQGFLFDIEEHGPLLIIWRN